MELFKIRNDGTVQFTWPQESMDLTRDLYTEGRCSAGIIAERLSKKYGGVVTRSAVCGKLNRMGLSVGRGEKRTQEVKCVVRGRPRKPAVARAQPGRRIIQPKIWQHGDSLALRNGPEIEVAPERRVGIGGLGPTQCNWPIGHPEEKEFHWCDRQKLPGLPYCESHCRRAYEPLRSRKRPVARPPVEVPSRETVDA